MNLSFNVHEINKEKVKISHKNITKYVQNSIFNKIHHSRILYAGINFDNIDTMIVCKVVELFRGKYYYQETVYNPAISSVHTTLTSLSKENFHGIVSAKEKAFNNRFYPNPQVLSATSYARGLGNNAGTFKNTIINDYRNNKGYLSPICDFWTYYRLQKYLNK